MDAKRRQPGRYALGPLACALDQALEAEEITLRDAASLSGLRVNHQALKDYLDGCTAETPEMRLVARRILRGVYLRQLSRHGRGGELAFHDFAASRIVSEALDEIYRQSTIGMVLGVAGSGKSRAIQQWAANGAPPETVPIECDRVTWPADLLLALAGALGLTLRGRLKQRLEQLIEALLAQPRYLVLDQLDDAPVPTIDLIRRLWDETRQPVALLGTEVLRGKLERGDLNHLRRRITITFQVPPLSRPEVERLLREQGVDPGNKNDREYLYLRTEGNIGFLKNVIAAIQAICRTESLRRPDRRVIDAALDRILPQLYRVLIPGQLTSLKGLSPYKEAKALREAAVAEKRLLQEMTG